MDEQTPGQTLAVRAQSLYLLNLLLLPGIAFVLLTVLWWRHQAGAPPLARCHLWQTMSASVWGGILLLLINGIIILTGGYQSPWVWVIVGLYFTVCHAGLVLLGLIGLAKAMAGQGFHFPLIGTQRCDLCR